MYIVHVDVVVDASVILAVLLNEPRKKILVNNLKNASLISAGALPYEIGNALSALIKRGRLNKEKTITALASFSAIPMRLVDVSLEGALAIAMEYNLYAYDAYDLEVAKRLRVPLTSLDAKMLEIAVRLKISVLEV